MKFVEEFFKGQSIPPFLSLFISLILAGATLIIVNVLTHSYIDNRNVRKERERLVQRNLKPVLKAAEGLISRIVEILVIHHSILINDISTYKPNAISMRISKLSALAMNRHETTAFRLINFLAIANNFGRQTSGIPLFRLLERIEFYLQHKISVGFRGNLYEITLLSTEVQEDLAVTLLERDKTISAQDFSIGQFCSYLNNGTYNSELFKAALNFFYVKIQSTQPIDSIKDGIKNKDNNARHIIALAHAGIYLIDFFQELDINPQWEEHRVFLVSLIVEWNKKAVRKHYLYELGDLNTGCYIDTFPNGLGSQYRILMLIDGYPRFLRRYVKYLLLKSRGSRFGKRHHKKKITKNGVKIKVNDKWYPIDWSENLVTIHKAVMEYSLTRLKLPKPDGF